MSNPIKSCLHSSNPLPLMSGPLRMTPEQAQESRSDWNLHNNNPVQANRNNLEDTSIYNQYLAYYQQCNDDVYAIDQLPADKRNQPNVQNDRATIIAQQAALGKIYQQDNSGKTLEQFIQDCADCEAQIAVAYNDAIGSGGTIHQQIQADYTSAQNITGKVASSLTLDTSELDVSFFAAALTALQAKVDALTDPVQKQKAQADLDQAKEVFSKLKADCTAAQSPLEVLQQKLTNIQDPINGALYQLKVAAAMENPSQYNLSWANARLGDIQTVQTSVQTFQSGPEMAAVTSDTSALNAAIQKVQQDLRPAPKPGDAEHSCWDIDWTTHMAQGTTIPPGVTMVNLFVGEIAMKNGVPVVDGFADLKASDIKAFADKCREQGVQVKISIGGGGGSYDNCWNVLNDGNIGTFAQMLVDFCHTNGLAGVDFDYEKYDSAAQQVLVGNLIRQFKTLDPTLQTTLCTNAGFGSQFPWPTIVQTIMDAACDPTTGECRLDRLNVMSYYDSVANEISWLDGWANWASQRYGFKPSQIGTGIDGFDGAHIGDMSYIVAMANNAAKKGFSTGYWAYNPADPVNSNKFCQAVYDNYNSGKTLLGRIWNVVKCAFRGVIDSIFSLLNPPSVDKQTEAFDFIRAYRLTAKSEGIKKAEEEWNRKPNGYMPKVSCNPVLDDLRAKASAKPITVRLPPPLNFLGTGRLEASAPPKTPKASAPAAPKNYIYEEYVNNWGGAGTPPPGVSGSQAFAVVNGDGTFDSRYPLAGGGNTALAVGGWNNSQVDGGLNTILTAPLNPDGSLTTVQKKLLDGLVSAAIQYGYKKILLDFEAYSSANPTQVSKTYTKFLQELGAQLHALGKQLDICTSPAVENQNYYDINQLLTSVDHYQVMTYDYAQGGSVVTGNASVSQSKTYLDTMLAKYPGLTQSMLMLGIPTYGIQFSITPGMAQDAVQAGIQAGTLQGTINNNQPGTGSAEMANDLILQDIGDWINPTNGWVLITTNANPADYFYYNQAKGSVITAFPPASVRDFATMVKGNYPDVTGFFGWEASDEMNGAIMKELINDTALPLNLTAANTEVSAWLTALRDTNQDPKLKQWAGNLLAKLAAKPPSTPKDLATILNGAFNPSGAQDIYMQIPALLEVDGQTAPNAGNVINLLNQLFAGNSDLLALQSLGLNIPTPTVADMTYAQVSSWTPQPETDLAVKTFILKNIGDAGSGFTHDQIKQLYWGNSWRPHKITQSDDALLQELMYANTSAVQEAYQRLVAWQPTGDQAKALKGKMLEEIDPTKKHFSKSEWQKYCEGIISKLNKVDAKRKIQALLGYKPVHHGNQGVKKV
ncbi:MAG: glycosyl hydrolase family 18 protein [Chlamydiae bacterium]|nr:glycosyl hydrolase family 18 protein [Chlamydiota bacterium]